MNHARVALALLGLVSGTRTVVGEPCAPRAVLSGDRAAVATVGDALQRLGVVLAPAAGRCGAIQATVELAREGGIAVAVAASGRSEGRVLGDPEIAAAWIDAWVRDDLEVATWAPSIAPSSAMAPPPSSSLVAPRDAPSSPAAPRHRWIERTGVTAAYEQRWTEDGATWSGASVAACVRIGGVCLGGRARAAFAPATASGLTAAARSDLSGLATASLPVELGTTIVSPELGIGVGRFATRRVEGCTAPIPEPMPNCNPADPTCTMPPLMCIDATGASPGGRILVGDHLAVASYTPRLELALRISVPLFHHVWLEGLAAISVMPLAHDAPYVPTKVPAGTTATDLSLPGEPSSGLALGVGLRVGAP